MDVGGKGSSSFCGGNTAKKSADYRSNGSSGSSVHKQKGKGNHAAIISESLAKNAHTRMKERIIQETFIHMPTQDRKEAI